MNKLPDKPSELIRLAIKDLILVEEDDTFELPPPKGGGFSVHRD